jgi:hypothetical protein
MTLTIDLSPDIEQRLLSEAGRLGIAPDQYIVQVLKQQLPASDRTAQFSAVLKSWMDEDDSEDQKATFDFLVRALDEDRSSERKLFPPELKGISW